MAFYKDENMTIQVGALSGSNREDLYRFCIPMMVLTTMAVALRIYVRGYMTKTFGVEDWLIIPAYVLYMALCICTIVIGEWLSHDDAMTRFPRVIKLTVGNSVLFIMDLIFTKLSVAFYFCRICERWQRYVIFGTVTIFSLYHVAFTFITVFQCGVPTVSNLVRALKTDGQCIDWPHIVRPLLYVAISLNAVCDWIFVLACLPMLTKLRRMPISEIFWIYFLIFLATAASVLSLARLGYLPGGGKDVLLLKHSHTFAVLSFTEAGTAIITVSLATLHPLFQACTRKKGGSRYPAPRNPRKTDSSEPTSCEKKQTDPISLEDCSTEHLSFARIGILPTVYDSDMTTMVERSGSHRGYTTDWT